jgi:small subunit ribosomal protein S17
MAKSITGVVSSSKADKTIVVTVRERKTHPLYRKQYTTSAKFMAHDENNEAKDGDTVVIVETRPISKRKSFKLESIVERAGIMHVEPEAAEVVKAKDVEEKA